MVTFNATDDYGPTRFIVSPILGNGSYTSVNAAIAAAAAAGGSQVVLVSAGTYNENVTFVNGVFVVATSSNVLFVGAHVFQASGSNIATTVQGVGFTESVGGTVLAIGGSGGTATLTMIDCYTQTTHPLAFGISIANNGALIASRCNISSSNFSIITGGNALVNLDRCSILSTGAPGIGGNTSQRIVVDYCTVEGFSFAVDMNAVSSIQSRYSQYTAGNQQVMDLAGGTHSFYNDGFYSVAAVTPIFIGTGTLNYANLISLNGEMSFAGTLGLSAYSQGLGSTVRTDESQETILEGTVAGVATLTAGVVTVNTNAIRADSRVELTRQTTNVSTGVGALSVGTVLAGVSFGIASYTSSATIEAGDGSSVYWRIVQST